MSIFVRFQDLTLDEFESITIPDKYLYGIHSFLWNVDGKELYTVYFSNGYNQLKENKPCIGIFDDVPYSPEEIIEIYPKVEDIIAEYTRGLVNNDLHYILLSKKLTKEDVLEISKKYNSNKYFSKVHPLTTVDYRSVPKKLFDKSAHPIDKLKIIENI